MPEKTVDELVGLFPYLEVINWQGGEVFLVDYFEGLMNKASEYPNLKQQVVTNGSLLNERWAAKLARRGRFSGR